VINLFVPAKTGISMPEFIPGPILSESFYNEAARPILEANFPQLPHSAGILGWSSEVLGYDDLTSTDHNWGPRFQLFLSKKDYSIFAEPISKALSQRLPSEFRAYPTNFEKSGDQRAMARIDGSPISHKVDIHTVEEYFEQYLGLKSSAELSVADWLSFSEHKLLAVTRGRVFHDGLGSLEPLRRRFSYYPRDVWLYILAAQWEKLGEEEAFAARCAEVGDDLGSTLIAARQAKNLMSLCFMMEKKYAPYSKWFGTAFRELNCAETIGPILNRVFQSNSWVEREQHLSRAYEEVARMHNKLEITPPMPEMTKLHGRPYQVICAARFAEEIRRLISSKEVKKLKRNIGSVNQLVDSDQKISDPELCKQLKELHQ
jgi:hypothetical protein